MVKLCSLNRTNSINCFKIKITRFMSHNSFKSVYYGDCMLLTIKSAVVVAHDSLRNTHTLFLCSNFLYFSFIFIFELLPGEHFSGSSFGARLSLQPKLSRTSLTSEEAPTEYRRKSAGSPNQPINNSTATATEPYIYAFDECERHADGTVVLRYENLLFSQ